MSGQDGDEMVSLDDHIINVEDCAISKFPHLDIWVVSLELSG